MRTRTPAALAVTAALALAACGSDSSSEPAATAASEPATTDQMADDEMADDEMADDEMADDEMADDEMADDEMADDEMADDEMAENDATDDVVVVASGIDELTTFVAAVEAAGLTDVLSGDGPFTVFAPSDAAFAAYLAGAGLTIDDVLADPDALRALLENHVVSANDDAAMVSQMVDQPFVSLAGNELEVVVDGDTVTIGGVEIVDFDLFASNGVVHVIDGVLVPS